VRVPDQVDPGNVLLVVEFVKVLHEQGLVLTFEIDDSQTPLPFRFGAFLPSHHRFTSFIYIKTSPHAMSPDSIKVVMHCARH
jgi:hypothetical protein